MNTTKCATHFSSSRFFVASVVNIDILSKPSHRLCVKSLLATRGKLRDPFTQILVYIQNISDTFKIACFDVGVPYITTNQC